MKETVILGGKPFEYELTLKRIKNINLRIGIDGKIKVSAPTFVSKSRIEAFLTAKKDFICNAVNRANAMKNTENAVVLPPKEIIYGKFYTVLNKCYQKFGEYAIPFPKLKIRTMNSRWGSCNYVKKYVTLNTKLYFLEERLLEYVCVHELSHLVYANHSKNFYSVVSKILPNYKEREKELNKRK